jgi:cytochrome c5
LKKFVFLAMSVSVIVLAISCKHQIPGITDTPEPGGDSNTPAANSTCSADTVYFQQQVLPIFISNCAMSGCHDDASHEEGIVLTSYQSILSGGIRAGNPGNSKIYKVITSSKADDRMPRPPRNPLSQEQIDLISKWIGQGAKNNSCVNASCDAVTVTYSTSIKSIISDKCQGCHSGSSPAAGYDFSTYAGVQARINDGKLWGAVNHVSGYSAMPKNGTKLSTCELAKIKNWIDAGAPNN